MKQVFVFVFCALALTSIGQVDYEFAEDEFSSDQFTTGAVFAEMTAITEKGRTVIEFDFGSTEDSKVLRKETLWDKENNEEYVFQSTIDALTHLEKIQWTTRNVVVDKNGDEIFKYFLLEKIAGF